jgi:hypothetical protein
MRVGAHGETDYAEGLRASGRAYLDFAVANAALLDLMFTAKKDKPPQSLLAAAETLFATISEIMFAGVTAGVFHERDIQRLTLLMSATMQGISTFVGAGRASVTMGYQLIDDTIALFIGVPLS